MGEEGSAEEGDGGPAGHHDAERRGDVVQVEEPGSGDVRAEGCGQGDQEPQPWRSTRTANGHLTWPARRSGWTVVLASYPEPKGRATARATAERAARARLAQVGTLDSSNYASLNPGYDVVFSGIYGSSAEAQTALERVRQAGFGAAHLAQIAR